MSISKEKKSATLMASDVSRCARIFCNGKASVLFMTGAT